MATRVKKYAQQIGRTPGQVLGLLQAMGYTRYRTPQDMLPDAAIERLQKAIREGLKADPVEVPEELPPPKPKAPPRAPSFMDRVLEGDTKPAPSPVARSVAPPTAPPPSESADLSELRAALEDARRAVQGERDLLAELRAELTSVRETLEAERAQLATERAQLADDVVAHQTRVQEWMAERAALEAAALEAKVSELTREVGQRLMLEGLRRVTIVGGDAESLKALRAGVDPRVELRYAAGERGSSEAAEDAGWGDLVLVWGVSVSQPAVDVYSERRTRLIVLPESTLAVFLSELLRVLSASD